MPSVRFIRAVPDAITPMPADKAALGAMADNPKFQSVCQACRVQPCAGVSGFMQSLKQACKLVA